MKIAERLLQLRQEQGLTLRELAEKVEITAAALSSYEKGKKEPSLEYAVKLAKYYGKTLDYLCGIEDVEQSQSYADLLMFILKMVASTGVELHSVPGRVGCDGKVESGGGRSIRCRLDSHDPYTQFVLEMSSADIAVFFETYVKLSELTQNGVIPTSVFTNWLSTTLANEAKLSLALEKTLDQKRREKEEMLSEAREIGV